MVERLLKPADVAERLNVSRGSVREWLRTGKLKARKAGSQWRIREEDVEEFLKKGKEPK